MVFVLFSDELENGFSEVMIGMRSRYSFMSSLEFRIAAAPELVIENAFDQKHFIAVHGIDHDPGLQLEHGERGELQVKGVLVTRTCDWQRRANEESVCQTRFAARVFSPNVCVSEMHIGTTSFAVITGATPGVGQSCDIRISIGCSSEIPAKDRQAIIASLAHYTRLALEQDINIWEHMIDPVAPTFMPADSMVLVFRRWCQQFRATCHQLAAR
jgi:hypothetical protein